MDPLATTEDVEARLGVTLNHSDEARVAALLDDASELVRLEAGQDWVSTVTAPGAVKAVVLRMVDRAYRNPEGFSAESDGDYSYQRTQVQPGVYLTDAERAIIRRATGRSGLWTQPTTRGETCIGDTVWYEDQYGCELFPLDTYRNY